MSQPPQIAPPAATGNAGPQFEASVGAFYLLSLLSGSEPRGLSGAMIRTVEFQQRASGHPLDDIIIRAMNADGSAAILEIQAKRTLTFTASDKEFRDVVAQVWEAAQKTDFGTIRYELAVAIARTTTRVEHACQEALHWARQLSDGATFAAHIDREKFSSKDMRDFVDVFRTNLALAHGLTDDETVWRLLRSFQILPFDFESPGSDYEHRARERARLVLIADQAERAAELWPVLIHQAGVCARAGGALDRPTLVTPLEKQYGFHFDQRADLRAVNNRLADAAKKALDEISDEVGGVKLSRTELIDQAVVALDRQPVLHIVGAPGCGKSWVMKHLARLIQPEGRIIVLRNGRVIPGGWLPMAHTIGCAIGQKEFFNELGCGGGAILFIDNIDQINDAGEWATIQDLMAGVIESPGWRAVVTGGLGQDDWKTKLTAVKRTDIATLEVGSVTDDEIAALSEGNHALAVILNENHPAKGIARNLFYLSRLIELSNGDTELAAGIATEIDLASLWWRYGGGRAEDDGRLARLKLLRTIGAQTILNPGRATYLIDELDTSIVASLLRFDSLQEDIKGATVSFRHDVLRDWTVGFLLHERKDLVNALPFDQSLPVGLGRGLEIAARLALDADIEGRGWLELLSLVEREGGHGSWKRPILLALIRSEDALTLMMRLKSVLLESGGRRLSEIIRLMIAVESQPLAKAIARLRPTFPIPPGVDDLIIPKGAGWTWLVIWLVTEAAELPTDLIPDVARVFQAWLIATQNQPLGLNSKIVGLLFEWLALIEDRMAPRVFRSIEEAPPLLNFPHVREVRDRVQMAAFAFARQNPAAAARYLSAVSPDTVRHHDQQSILRAPGSLSVAAPKEMVDFILRTIIEKDDPKNRRYRSRHRHGPFGAHDHLYSRASPSQGPFLDLLENAPAEGLRLIRSVVEHATDWQREQYREARRPFPRVTVPFPEGSKSFEGDWSVYYWARSIMPSTITASALMALEAWAHQQIEAGRPFVEVLHDVLGSDGSSIAFLAVAVDLALSHFPIAYDVAWPIVATPEVLAFDNARHTRDITGVDRLSAFDQEVDTGRVKRADLDAKPSRTVRLMDTFGQYVFRGKPEQLIALRAALEQARNEIKQKPAKEEDPINGVSATAERALRMTFAEHWPRVKMRLQDASETEVYQYQADSTEQQLTEERQIRANGNLHHLNVRLRVQAAFFDGNKSTPEIVREGIEWAKKQPEKDEDETSDHDDFSKDWDHRAVVMAAALAVRDYMADDRPGVINWARSTLVAAAKNKGKKFHGNSQIEYNATAIAVLGLTSLYLLERDHFVRDLILRLASHQHEAVVRALGQTLTNIAQSDERLARSIIRIIMTSSIHFHRTESDEDDQAANQSQRQDRIESAIKSELQWLDGGGDELDWPELPKWWLRRRRGVRLPGGSFEDDTELEDARPEAYVDEHALGTLVNHLTRFTIGELPGWLLPLTAHLMDWTFEANGPHGEQEWQSDNRPTTWNHEFFDFAGVLSVALPHEQVSALFVAPIAKLGDEAFYDAAAIFLRGYDRATLATNTKTPENPAAIRVMFADRIRSTWNYRRYDDEKTFSMETHAGDAVTAMFYQPSPFMNRGQPSVPGNWDGLDATVGILTDLAVGALTSGYIAVLYLNLIGASPRAALLPYVVKAATAWCSGYGSDTNFWSERDIGHRLCAWLDTTMANDPIAAIRISEVRDDLLRCLDILIQSGVSQASEIEVRISAMTINRKTA